jgi:hypothetical protein
MKHPGPYQKIAIDRQSLMLAKVERRQKGKRLFSGDIKGKGRKRRKLGRGLGRLAQTARGFQTPFSSSE